MRLSHLPIPFQLVKVRLTVLSRDDDGTSTQLTRNSLEPSPRSSSDGLSKQSCDLAQLPRVWRTAIPLAAPTSASRTRP
jgi:hypothetical protein